MGGIAESLRASHRRARDIREHGYMPHGMVYAIENADRAHEKFKDAIESMRKSADTYHEKRLEQRQAGRLMADKVSEGRDIVEKLDDDIQASL